MKRQILRFGLVGVVGYVVDSVMLYVALAFGFGFTLGRFFSFLFAVVVTWILNRRYTFAEQLCLTDISQPSIWMEFWRYLSAMSLGGVLNLGAYGAVVAMMPPGRLVPAFGVAVGSLVGMIVNFTGAKCWVYKNGQ
jgi:putative flippase GtrA